MKRDDEFRELGRVHAASGLPRHKFQDSYLQKLYNEGYEDFEKQEMRRCRSCGCRMYDEGYQFCNNCR